MGRTRLLSVSINPSDFFDCVFDVVGGNSDLIYVLPKGIAGDKFRMDEDTGIIETTTQLDRELQDSYTLTGKMCGET